MKDVTELMNKYRECSRNIWNTYFGVQENWCDLESPHKQIRRLLFESLVVALLEEETALDGEGSPILKVVPFTSMSILIRRSSKDGNVYWDQESDLRADGTESLGFIDYYDFFQYPFRDYRFYRCKVLRFPTHPEYEGKEALVDVAAGKVFCNVATDGTPTN